MDRLKLSFVFAALVLLCACVSEGSRAEFNPASVKAQDLKKLDEQVERGASLDGLNRVATMVPSPDGTRIARVERVGSGIESLQFAITVSPVSGGGAIRIAEVVNCYGLAWSPDGTKLAYSEGTMVHIADSDGQTRQTVHVGPGGPYPGASFDLTWSEDGQRLSFVQVSHARDPDLADPVKVTIKLGV